MASTQSLGLFLAIAGTAIWLLYRRLLPKPIPGIPYDPEAAKKLFGDLPAALEYEKKHGTFTRYFKDQCNKLNSPVVQVWVQPFAKPWVVCCDGREAQDAMTKDLKRMDRAPMFGDIFTSIVPHSQIAYDTGPDWKRQRNLVSATMLPEFLSKIAMPRAYEATLDLVDLWKQKSRLASGAVFEGLEDIHSTTTDAIWHLTFGSVIGTLREQVAYLQNVDGIQLPKDQTREIVQIPAAKPAKAYESLAALLKSCQISVKFGPRIHWLFVNLSPELRAAKRLRDQLISQQIDKAYHKFSKDPSSTDVHSAMDLVIQREVAAAKKEDRKPLDRDTRKHVHNELALFTVAGSGTTADTLCWALKELGVQQNIQANIRQHMQETLREERANKEQPSAAALYKLDNPYLSAFIEETLRFHPIANAPIRHALHDTQLLGYHIPKGTVVAFPTTGASMLSPAFNIDESVRSASSQVTKKEDLAKWSAHADLDVFRAERWLKDDGAGKTVFDAQAAPMATFGAGPRSCFGKRLAYLELRLVLSLLLWNFEFERVPDALMNFDMREELTQNARDVHIKLRSTS